MQLYFFKDSFTIYHIKAGKRIFSLGHNLIEILEFPFLFLLFSFFFFSCLTISYKVKTFWDLTGLQGKCK